MVRMCGCAGLYAAPRRSGVVMNGAIAGMFSWPAAVAAPASCHSASAGGGVCSAQVSVGHWRLMPGGWCGQLGATLPHAVLARHTAGAQYVGHAVR